MPVQGPDLRYRQVYSHDIFTKPVMITGLRFYSGYSTLIQADYQILLATTPAPDVLPYWNAFSDPANSVVFYSGRAGTTTPDFSFETSTFDFSGKPFYYDPAQGNLTVVIHGSNYGPPTFSRMIGISDGTAPFDFMLSWPQGAAFEYGAGMATTFITTDPVNVPAPEPGTIGLSGVLLAAAAAVR